MNRSFWLTFLFAVAVSVVATQGFARGGHGGGHGGGHHSGGHHAGGHHANHAHHANHGHHTHHVTHHGMHRPFSHEWYGRHQSAWGWGNGGYGWGNPWAAATLGTTAAWLGISALDGAGYQGNDTTVYTGDEGAPADQTADTADEKSPALEPSATEAAELSTSGVTETPAHAKFLPLGVYSIAPQGQSEASAVVHLAVSKEGVLRGTYYDLKADKDYNIQGAVDKKSGRVAWTVPSEGKAVFETTLANLTDESGPMSVHFKNGETQEWTMGHYAEDDASEKQADEAQDEVEVKTGEGSGFGVRPTQSQPGTEDKRAE